MSATDLYSPFFYVFEDITGSTKRSILDFRTEFDLKVVSLIITSIGSKNVSYSWNGPDTRSLVLAAGSERSVTGGNYNRIYVTHGDGAVLQLQGLGIPYEQWLGGVTVG